MKYGILSKLAKEENAKSTTIVKEYKYIIDMIHKELVDNDSEFYYETVKPDTDICIESRTIDSNITMLKITMFNTVKYISIRNYVLYKYLLFTTEDNYCGSEDLNLWVYNLHTQERKLVENHVGPSLAVTDTHLYYTLADKHLIYKHVMSINFVTSVKNSVYFERDERFNVYVRNLDAKNAVIDCQNTRLTSESIIINGFTTGRKHGINYKWLTYNVYLTNYTNPYYEIRTRETSIWNANEETGSIVDAKICECGWIILTVKNAQVQLYYTADNKTIQILKPTYATIQLMSDGCFLFKSPTNSDIVYKYENSGLKIIKQDKIVLPNLTTHSHYAISSDYTRIPYMTITAKPEIKGLIVIGYGAYGIMLNLSYPKRWLPLLLRGYAIVYAFVRGGWENGDSWYRGGSLRNRGHGRQDLVACIASAQRTFGVSALNTTLYGRSAGGFLVASTANRFPDVINRIYMEAPFLDVLYTMSNPALPLTQLEYDEFGHPKKQKNDAHILEGLSPIDNIKGHTFVKHVIIRAATHDSQVLYYESDKWVAKIKKTHKKTNIFYHVDECEGHFVEHTKQLRNIAEDMAIILST